MNSNGHSLGFPIINLPMVVLPLENASNGIFSSGNASIGIPAHGNSYNGSSLNGNSFRIHSFNDIASMVTRPKVILPMVNLSTWLFFQWLLFQ